MNYHWFIGIDVSKQTLDITVLYNGEKTKHFQIENAEKSIKLFLKELQLKDKVDIAKSLFCMEHTGIYNSPMLKLMEERSCSVCLESAVQIKQSGGLQRGKNDQVDSYRIALYAYKNREFLHLWEPERPVIKRLRKLRAVRERLINAGKQLQISLKEELSFTDKALQKQITDCCKRSLSALRQDIKRTDEAIQELIESDAELKELYSYIESIPGVGKVTATEIVINTNEFKRIRDPRKYACYAGVAPFEHASGTSVRGKTRISKKANMRAKSLLHMAALVASRYCDELRLFYQRKVAEGKNKMNVINAVKNKIIHRIFACVLQKRFYTNNYKLDLTES